MNLCVIFVIVFIVIFSKQVLVIRILVQRKSSKISAAEEIRAWNFPGRRNLGFKILKDYFECYISPHTFIQMTTKFISKLIQNSFTQLFYDILEDIKKFRPSLWRSWNKLAKLKFIP